LIDNQDGFIGLIGVREGISDYWLPYKIVGLIGNQDGFTGLIGINDEISNY
jgi:hypothetical protein